MLLHQGIRLDAFNALPMRRAVHAVFECCFSVPLAADLARARPFDSHDQLFRCADSLLFGLSEESVDSMLQAFPDIGRRPGGVSDGLHNDDETARKAVRNELARINRTRLERMLGPEGGYDNW
ncbi:MAG: 2-oxo-4-hydroxy-4-carboxy-5-ureidoimidazoline decarboxylase [Mycobacterium sp.]